MKLFLIENLSLVTCNKTFIWEIFKFRWLEVGNKEMENKDL